MPSTPVSTAATAPAASQATNASNAVPMTIRLATGFPLPFTVHLLPDAVHELRKLTRRDAGIAAQHDQLPRPPDDALVVAIGERGRAPLRLDKGAEAALQAQLPFLLQIAIDASDGVGVDAECDRELTHGRERVAGGERAAVDEQTDLLGQLHVNGQRARAIDPEPAGHAPMMAE